MGHEVQQTRWDRIIRRVSGSIGPGSRVSETLTEVMPVIDLERVPAELLLLGGTRMAMGFSTEPAVVDNFQLSMLSNPAGSNAIITLYSLSMSSTGTAGFGLNTTRDTYANTNLTTTEFTDGRLLPSQIPVGAILDVASVVAATESYLLITPLGDSVVFAPRPAIAVLTPGTAFSVANRQLNKTLLVNYTWTERPAEESELNL